MNNKTCNNDDNCVLGPKTFAELMEVANQGGAFPPFGLKKFRRVGGVITCVGCGGVVRNES